MSIGPAYSKQMMRYSTVLCISSISAYPFIYAQIPHSPQRCFVFVGQPCHCFSWLFLARKLRQSLPTQCTVFESYLKPIRGAKLQVNVIVAAFIWDQSKSVRQRVLRNSVDSSSIPVHINREIQFLFKNTDLESACLLGVAQSNQAWRKAM